MASVSLLVLFLLLTAPGFPLAELAQSVGAAAARTAEEARAGQEEALPGGREVKDFAAAWPDRIAETAFREGEWMLRVGDAWFAWANGRLLPEAERSRWEEFASLPLYRYPLALPPLAVIDEETAARLRQRVREDAANPPRRHEEFLGRLLQAGSRAETEAHIVRMEVAGFTVTVHERLAEPLARVSEELRALRLADPAVTAFLAGLTEMNGYNYRYVEGTHSRSFHSYGLAVDLVPKSYGGRHAYWMWAMSKVRDFWTVPYERRWMVPAPVVEAFERNGFVWGGKWLFFDTMHFEYRPEILLMAQG
ncbi:MAG: M15 family metallopeptidase [Spirochaetes bacterium]|nr:M15 family metallopeptidase [Spirochaetota bacterium]